MSHELGKAVNFKVRITLLLILSIQVCKAQWAQMSHLPDSTFTFGTSFTIGNKGYLLNTRCYNELWEYDSQNDTWTKKANFPGVCRFLTSGFSINGKGYVGLGRNNNNIQETDFWEYDPSTDSWTQKAQFPGTGRGQAVGFSIGNKGYLGTGTTPTTTTQLSGIYHNDFWEYDPTLDAWTQKANVPDSARTNAVGISLNGKGYLGLGSIKYPDQSRTYFYEYDPILDVWTQKQSIPEAAIRDLACIFHLHNEIYVVGGIKLSGPNGPEYLSTCLKYNPASNAWSYQPSFGGNAAAGQVALTFSNAAYVGSGLDAQNTQLTEWYRFVANLTSIPKTESNDLTIEFYPNPARDHLNISSFSLTSEKELKLLSIDGRVFLYKQINSANEKIDVSFLPQGVFIAEVTGSGISLRKKIIKE